MIAQTHAWRMPLLALACASVIMSCTKTESSAASAGNTNTVAKAGQVTMKMSKKCKPDALSRSRCMIDLMLDDVMATYGQPAGGGISSIKAMSSTSYQISLPQEERVDIFTYDFDVKADGTVSIKGKKESTKNP